MAFRGRLLLSTTLTDESNRIELLLIETGEMRSGDSSETRADGSQTKYQ